MVTKLVGILNITPDSFSDGGRFNSLDAALNHLKKMLEEGADIIDIGAESTRPKAIPISQEEEWSRLEKILPTAISEIKKYPKVQSSIDSYHFENIKKAHQLGINIINDVSGLSNERIVQFIAEKNITTILMHNLATHANPNLVVNPSLNIHNEIIAWAQNKISYLLRNGVKKSQLIFDPGIGFAKDAQQSIHILKNIDTYRILGLPLYVGHSKKSFLDSLEIAEDRAQKTLKISKFLIDKNVEFLRIHDVFSHKKLLTSCNPEQPS